MLNHRFPLPCLHSTYLLVHLTSPTYQGRAYQLQNKLDEAKETLLRSITLQNKLEGKPSERTFKYYMEVEQQMGEL